MPWWQCLSPGRNKIKSSSVRMGFLFYFLGYAFAVRILLLNFLYRSFMLLFMGKNLTAQNQISLPLAAPTETRFAQTSSGKSCKCLVSESFVYFLKVALRSNSYFGYFLILITLLPNFSAACYPTMCAYLLVISNKVRLSATRGIGF